MWCRKWRCLLRFLDLRRLFSGGLCRLQRGWRRSGIFWNSLLHLLRDFFECCKT